MTRLAAVVGWDLDRTLAAMGEVDFAWLEGRVAAARALVESLTAADLGRRVVPPDPVLSVVQRYEAHLSRELGRALDALERARALRRVR